MITRSRNPCGYTQRLECSQRSDKVAGLGQVNGPLIPQIYEHIHAGEYIEPSFRLRRPIVYTGAIETEVGVGWQNTDRCQTRTQERLGTERVRNYKSWKESESTLREKKHYLSKPETCQALLPKSGLSRGPTLASDLPSLIMRSPKVTR